MNDCSRTFLTLGRLEGAAERIKMKDKWPAHHLDTMALIGTLRDRLAAARVEPKPLFGFIKKTGEKSRLLVKVHPEDRILHKALLKVVERPPRTFRLFAVWCGKLGTGGKSEVKEKETRCRPHK